MRRRVPLTVALLGTAAAAGLLAGGVQAAPGGLDPSFGVPRVVDPIHTYGEPDITIGPAYDGRPGDVVVSGPQGTGVQRSVLDYSVDDGDSWRVVDDVPQGAHPAAVPSKSTMGPGGGDTEAVFDDSGRLYYDDLYALTCFTAAVVTDHGATVQSTPTGCSSPPGDRQWYALNESSTTPYKGPRPLLYLEYNDLVTGGRVDRSTDGLTFTKAGELGDGTGGWNVADSPILVDPASGDVLAAVEGTKHAVGLAVGVPDAAGDLTFHYHRVTGPRAGSLGTLFPVIAEDRDRNLYIAWVEDCAYTNPECYRVWSTWAPPTDDWSHWSTPRLVDNTATAVMPWITAGAGGIVDVVWYGADKRVDPSTTQDALWNAWMAQIVNADTDHPVVRQGKVSPHPVHDGSICLLGTGCITAQGNRNLADFFQVAIDNDGRARVVYDDMSNDLYQPAFGPTEGTLDHKGAPVVTVATQNTGVNNWTGRPLRPKESTAPVDSVTDPTGDSLANKALGGGYVKGADITRVALARSGQDLVVTVTTAGSDLATAASAAGGEYGQLVVRWQRGTGLYYAEVEQSAAGGAPSFFAGASGTIDLCSVSACNPHYLTYPGPPNGGSAVTGTVASGAHGTTYTIRVPLSAVGDQPPGALLEEVAGYVFASGQSATVPVTNAQAQVEEGIPVEIEGTRTFNARP